MEHTSDDVGSNVSVKQIGEGIAQFVEEETGQSIVTDTVINLSEVN